MEWIRRTLFRWSRETALYARALGKWLLLSALVGLLSGLAGTFFHIAVEAATELRGAHPWLLYGLPLAGGGRFGGL